MISILDVIKQLIPAYYNVKLTDMPDKGDVLRITETSIIKDRVSLEDEESYINTNVQLYVRQDPAVRSYSTIMNDLQFVMDTVDMMVGAVVDSKEICDFKNENIFPLGKDKYGNYLMSASFDVIFSLVEPV